MLIMEATRPQVMDLASLARIFTARAIPVSKPTAGEVDQDPIEVEVRILTTIHDAVRARAATQHQEVADVARAVLFQAAEKVTPAQIRAYRKSVDAKVKQAAEKAAERALKRGLSPAEAERLGRAAGERARRARLPLRKYIGVEQRHRLRFIAPRGAYEVARDAILAGGKTVVSVVEDGLKAYARTGEL